MRDQRFKDAQALAQDDILVVSVARIGLSSRLFSLPIRSYCCASNLGIKKRENQEEKQEKQEENRSVVTQTLSLVPTGGVKTLPYSS